MAAGTSESADVLITPWTLRAYEALPASPMRTGVVFGVVCLLLFMLGRALVDSGNSASTDDVRVAVIHILLMAYSASAYAYLLMSAKRTTLELADVAQSSPSWRTAREQAGKYRYWVLPIVGALSYLVFGVLVTNATTPDSTDPWDWRHWNYVIWWHRITTVFFAYWIACLSYVLVVESLRLSQLSQTFEAVDLLDLQPYQPLIRQGLTNALLLIGLVSLMSLLWVESRYGPVLIVFWVFFGLLATAGLMLPLRGMRRQLRAARERELDWYRRALKEARDQMKSAVPGHQSIAELTAYRGVVENAGSWPLDSSVLFRFALYLLIPLGSWLGGALVELGLDSFLKL